MRYRLINVGPVHVNRIVEARNHTCLIQEIKKNFAHCGSVELCTYDDGKTYEVIADDMPLPGIIQKLPCLQLIHN